METQRAQRGEWSSHYRARWLQPLRPLRLRAERILYGSDASGRSFASQLAKVHGADLPEAAQRRIFAENLIGLLAPILREKGIKF